MVALSKPARDAMSCERGESISFRIIPEREICFPVMVKAVLKLTHYAKKHVVFEEDTIVKQLLRQFVGQVWKTGQEIVIHCQGSTISLEITLIEELFLSIDSKEDTPLHAPLGKKCDRARIDKTTKIEILPPDDNLVTWKKSGKYCIFHL